MPEIRRSPLNFYCAGSKRAEAMKESFEYLHRAGGACVTAAIAWGLGAPWVYCLVGGGGVAFVFLALWLATDSIARQIPTNERIYQELEANREIIVKLLAPEQEPDTPPKQTKSADLRR